MTGDTLSHPLPPPVGRARRARRLALLLALVLMAELRSASAATLRSPSIGEICTPSPDLPVEFSRSLSPEFIPGNVGVSVSNLPLRVGPDAFAAIVAAREAFYERAYYLNAIDASPYSAEYTYLGDVAPTNVYFVTPVPYPGAIPSNRVVSTIRFAWREYLDMCRHLSQGLNFPWGLTTCAFYEGSSRGAGLSTIGLSRRNLATSLDLTGHEAGPVFPEFDWTAPDAIPSALAGWNGAFYIGAITNDDLFAFHDDYETIVEGASFPVDYLPFLLEDIALNCMTNPEAVVSLCSNKLFTTPKFFTNVLATAFGTDNLVSTNGLGYGLITNGSGRLVFDRLAAYNQAASAVDRTLIYSRYLSDFYDVTDAAIPFATSHLYTVKREAAGSFPAFAITYQGGGRLEVNTSARAQWGSSRETVDDVVTNLLPSLDLEIFVEPGGETGGAAANTIKLFECYVSRADFSDRSMYVSSDWANGRAVFTVEGPMMSALNDAMIVSIKRQDDGSTAKEVAYPLAASFPISNGIPVHATASASYLVLHPNVDDFDNFYLQYPCQRAFDTGRVQEVNFAVLSPLWESSAKGASDLFGTGCLTKSKCDTVSGSDPATLASGLNGALMALSTFMFTAATEKLGADVRDGRLVKNHVSEILDSVEQHTNIDSASLATTVAHDLTATVTLDEHTETVTDVVFSYGSGHVGSVSVDVNLRSYHTVDPITNEYAAGTQPLISECVDWRFKVLSRRDPNQGN